jgi:hypothetical protein
MPWEKIIRSRDVWLGRVAQDCGWPEEGVAIEGDFAGIQGYVFKPVPGARGAAKRLRGRSLQVSAITALVADRVREVVDGEIFYSAGGRFLVMGRSRTGWKEPVADLQRRLDQWIGKEFRGEVVFHLAGAEFKDGKIPREDLGSEMRQRRLRALEQYLQDEGGWTEASFLLPPGEHAFQCPASPISVWKPNVVR